MTMTQSHRFMTTFMSCSIRKNVLPPLLRFSIRSMRLPAKAGFTPATGSSSKTNVGSDMRARDSSRSFFCPPDSARACSFASPSSCVSLRISRARAREILKLTQLDGLANEHARALSGGQKKLLELSRALMSDPTLVLLDEPVAGVNPALAGSLMDLIENLRRGGRTFFLIEHDMNVVMNRCDWVIVMHQGRRIAEGPPESVKADPAVIESYLGG